MKGFVVLTLALACALASPVKQARRRDHREEDPLRQTYFLVERSEGVFEVEDLVHSNVTVKTKLSDVTYYLYTRSNQEEGVEVKSLEDLKENNFNPAKISIFIVHGWKNNHESKLNVLVTPALLSAGDFNIFVVDWSVPANYNYISAKGSVLEIGNFVGDFVNDLNKEFSEEGFAVSSVFCVGHSLGAHVCGNAGARAEGLFGHIVGLDPASPLFSLGNTEERLDQSDAGFVHVIHTCGGLLGFSSSIGHADFYPNGGSDQPGCGLDLAGSCAHSRSYQYFAESIYANNFIARLCGDMYNYEKGLCDSNLVSKMGGVRIDTKATGDFFLKTNSQEPFGLGD